MATLIELKEGIRYFCFSTGVDMRKGIHSLYGLIKQENSLTALSGDVFLFIGMSQKSVKILIWQTNGFVLYHKRLELGRFVLPHKPCSTAFYELTSPEVDRLMFNIKHRSVGADLRIAAMLSI